MTIEKLYNLFQKYPDICIDTREISTNCLFFALKGQNFDGNKFADEALKKGAAYAIVDNTEYSKNKKCIQVEDVLITLQQLANYHRKKLNMPVLAVTGTNGKTTTKELIKRILSEKYIVNATKGNFNNHIGVPLTLLSFSKHTEFGIVEMGANHLNEIAALCRIAEPNYGIITNIGKAHIEGFGSIEGVIQTKTELYQYLSFNNGKVFCNKKNRILVENIEKYNCDVIYYGENDSQIKIENIENDPYLHLKIHYKDYVFDCNTKLIGDYNIENIDAALCVGYSFNIGMNRAIHQIINYIPNNMRSQLVKTSNNNIIADSYNANPTSMKLAIDNFNNLQFNKKVLILGDMLELGESEDQEHKLLCDYIENMNFYKVILIGPVFKNVCLHPDILTFLNVDALKETKLLNDIKGCNILIKGSRGTALEKIMDYL